MFWSWCVVSVGGDGDAQGEEAAGLVDDDEDEEYEGYPEPYTYDCGVLLESLLVLGWRRDGERTLAHSDSHVEDYREVMKGRKIGLILHRRRSSD